MGKKVEVVSCVSGTTSLNLPELRLIKVWSSKGAKNLIDREQLAEAFYEPGVEYLFTHGILYIKDAELRQELGLEAPSEEGETTASVIVLSDAEIDDYLNKKQQWEFEKVFKALSREQQYNVIEYAIAHECSDMRKADVMKKVYGIDVISAINLKRKNEESSPADNNNNPRR